MELASLAWAAATFQVADVALSNPLMSAAVSNLQHYPSRELATLAWAVAKISDPARCGLVVLPESFGEAVSALPPSKFHVTVLRETARETQSRVSEMAPRDLANLVWALAYSGIQHPEIVLQARQLLGKVRQQAVEAIGSCLSWQDVSNIAWAYAAIGVNARDLFRAVWNSVSSRLFRLSFQSLANIAWALSVGGDFNNHRWGILLAQELWHRLEVEPSHCPFAPGSNEDSLETERAARAFALDVCSTLWALTFSGHRDRIPLLKAQASLTSVGCTLDAISAQSASTGAFGDEGHVSGKPPPPLVPVLASSGVLADIPVVLLDLPDRIALYKPAGWEVDSGVGDATNGATLALSAYLRNMLPASRWPLLESCSGQRGFLHRLDVPSSGLILAAKTWEALFDLQLQLSVGWVARDYIVLCRGWIGLRRRQVAARVHSPTDLLDTVAPWGRPSLTLLKVQARAVAPPSMSTPTTTE